MLEEYLVVDLEMTGLNPKTDTILEIGAVKVQGKQVQETFNCLVNPKRQLREQITTLTGITNDMAESGIELDTAMKAFREFAEDLPWVGHNIVFDYRFVKQWEVNHRIKRECYGIDTLKIARKCQPELEKKTLDYLCEHYHITRKIRHRALEDAMANQMIYEYFENKFIEQMPELFVPKAFQCKVKRQTPATLRQKNYLKELAEYHKIVLDVPIEQLSRSEASRLTDRLIHQYGRI